MSITSTWNAARAYAVDSITGFCLARDAHRGTAWERLGVAYPDPVEARRAVELFRSARLQIAAAA